jgi:hypothetical protein
VEKYVVFSQIFYGANVSEYGTFGEPDGLAYVNSWGASGGDTLTQDAKTWLIVQREMSTANETSAAMLLE